jgi:hypothetical protein
MQPIASRDVHEQEADRVAERVMRMAEPHVEIDRTGETAAPPVVQGLLHSSGQPLDRSTREFMERRFGHDFSRVRIHADARAAQSAQSLNALAYTVGSHLAFAPGQYSPATTKGRRLLAHELSHVLQQLRDGGPRIQRQETASSTAETDAKATATAAAATTVSADSVTITWGANADQSVVKAATRTIIKEIVATAGLTSCLITSTARGPEDQARAMYHNLETEGVAKQKKLYAAPGDHVIDVYVASKAAKKSAVDIKADMVAKINELGPSTVSNHCADANVLCVVDIAPSSISDKPKFIAAFEADARVSKSLKPPDDPAYHLEIPQ